MLTFISEDRQHITSHGWLSKVMIFIRKITFWGSHGCCCCRCCVIRNSHGASCNRSGSCNRRFSSYSGSTLVSVLWQAFLQLSEQPPPQLRQLTSQCTRPHGVDGRTFPSTTSLGPNRPTSPLSGSALLAHALPPITCQHLALPVFHHV